MTCKSNEPSTEAVIAAANVFLRDGPPKTVGELAHAFDAFASERVARVNDGIAAAIKAAVTVERLSCADEAHAGRRKGYQMAEQTAASIRERILARGES